MKLFTIIILITAFSFAQENKPTDKSWLDFWIGKWKLEWTDKNGSTGKGSCEIKKILGNKVVYEKFEAKKGELKGFKGRSFSVLDKTTNQWKQTWVDNNETYLEFTGLEEENKKIFQRKFTDKSGKTILQRIVFTNIEKNNFDWLWESSSDEGSSWVTNWKIKYSRKIKTEKTKNK